LTFPDFLDWNDLSTVARHEWPVPDTAIFEVINLPTWRWQERTVT
jgi:hypothetical protein